METVLLRQVCELKNQTKVTWALNRVFVCFCVSRQRSHLACGLRVWFFRISVFVPQLVDPSCSGAKNYVVRNLFCLIADRLYEKQKRREQNRRYYLRLKQDPERFRRVMKKEPALGTKAPHKPVTRPGPDSVPQYFGETEQGVVDSVRNRAAVSNIPTPPKPDPAHAEASVNMGLERKRMSGSEGPDSNDSGWSRPKTGGESGMDALWIGTQVVRCLGKDFMQSRQINGNAKLNQPGTPN